MAKRAHASKPRNPTLEIDNKAGQVRKNGVKVKLSGQPLEVLSQLLGRPGEVVSRDEFRQKLWPADTFVDFDHSLNTAVNKLREALGDDVEQPRIIETLPRRGYRLMIPFTEIRPGIFVSREPRGHVAIAAWGGLASVAMLLVLVALNVGGWRDRWLGRGAGSEIASLAVLPLENLSGDAQQEYFADAMTDALITDLGQIHALRVTSRTSVMQYKKTKKPLRQIARELGVDVIIEGAVVRSGDRVRITAQLIRGSSDRHLWAQSYEGELSDALKLQDEVARAITTQIRLKLSPEQDERLLGARRVNPQAYESYLKGSENCDRAQLERSIQLDPDFAPAYASLANCLYLPALYGYLLPHSAFSTMRTAALEAIAKDPQLALAHADMALVRLQYDWNWPEAEKEFRRALELNPNDADTHHLYAHYLLTTGRFEESARETAKAVDLDPFDAGLEACLGWHSLYARQFDQAKEHAMKAIEMKPQMAWGHVILGWAYEQKSMFAEAIAEFRQATKLTQNSPWTLAALGHAYAVSGQRKLALEVVAKLNDQAKKRYVSAYDMATLYAGLGEKDHTLEWLDKAYQERSGMLVQVEWDARFDPLHSDARFRELVRRIGLPLESTSRNAAAKFEFERAAALRDRIRALKQKNVGMLFQPVLKPESS